VRPASIDEALHPGERPDEHVERLARAKAELVALDVPDALVIGGDTIVLRDQRVLGKPDSEAEAVHMLMSLAGRSHEVLSGVALASAHGVVSGVNRTTVRFRDFDASTARRYVESGEPMDKAGAYGIQGLGAALVEGLDGDYYSVVGFPVGVFLELLGSAGWRYDFGGLARVAR
jgi:septum formation protein